MLSALEFYFNEEKLSPTDRAILRLQKRLQKQRLDDRDRVPPSTSAPSQMSLFSALCEAVLSTVNVSWSGRESQSPEYPESSGSHQKEPTATVTSGESSIRTVYSVDVAGQTDDLELSAKNVNACTQVDDFLEEGLSNHSPARVPRDQYKGVEGQRRGQSDYREESNQMNDSTSSTADGNFDYRPEETVDSALKIYRNAISDFEEVAAQAKSAMTDILDDSNQPMLPITVVDNSTAEEEEDDEEDTTAFTFNIPKINVYPSSIHDESDDADAEVEYEEYDEEEYY